MSRTTHGLSAERQRYLVEHSVRETDVERRVREDTASHPKSNMQIAPEQAQMMKVMAKMVDARLALEIGVFTGYSAMAVASALPPDGRLIACDVDEEFAGIARRNWKDAGLDHKIELRIGPAIDTLDDLNREGVRFDFAFIDADKVNLRNYYERVLSLLRPGGVVLIDNVFRGGDVVDASIDDASVRATRELNDLIIADDRVDPCMLPIADGVTVARKR